MEKPILQRSIGIAEVRKFNRSVADMTDRRKMLDEAGLCTTEVLSKIHRVVDPDGEKAMKRLRRVYSEF